MLEIKNLHVTVDGKAILKGLSLTVPTGEVHAIMGPNGSGKSTLGYALAGRAGYDVTEGEILWNGENLLEMEPEERAAQGVFLAFQYPLEIPGVATMTFLRTALNSVRKQRGEEELSTPAFMKVVKAKAKGLGVKEEMLKRALNVGFSGGEKKRMEILQMALLEPSLCVLDETDSGLDIDAVQDRLGRRQRAALQGAHDARHHALSAPPRLHRARQGACAGAGIDPALGRQGARRRARAVGLCRVHGPGGVRIAT